jgi:hypothetical protein
MEPSSVARAMLPETSTALSAASRLKTSSPRPEKIGFVSKTLTMEIRRTGLARHSAHAREGRFGQPGTLVATWRMSGIGASRPLPCVPAMVSFLIQQRALSVCDGNWSSCPGADLCPGPKDRSGQRVSGHSIGRRVSSIHSARRDNSDATQRAGGTGGRDKTRRFKISRATTFARLLPLPKPRKAPPSREP